MSILQTKKSREKLGQYRKGHTTSKCKVKVGMLEVTLEGGECLGKKKNDQKHGGGKAQGLLWKRNGSDLART